MVAYTCDPKTWEMEAERPEFQGHPHLHNELEVSKLPNLSKKKNMTQVW